MIQDRKTIVDGGVGTRRTVVLCAACFVTAFFMTALSPSMLWGQSASLYHRTVPLSGDRAVELKDTYGYIPVPPPRELRKYDIVMIRVDDTARTKSTGETSARKNALYDAILKDWPFLIGLKAVKPSPQILGDQRLNGQLNSLYRSEGELETNESIALNIAAQIVDIRPNGNLVLEAHKNIRINNEVWEVSVTGECRADDVGPDNTVLSRNMAQLDLQKMERGSVRDSYRRGWVTKLFHLFQPF